MIPNATPTSRKDLSNLARKFRKIIGVENQLYMPIVQLIELILPRIDPKFDLEIVSIDELPTNTYAITYPDESKMIIREDVYNDVCEDQGRARFTLAHEFFHYIFHGSGNIGFARSMDDVPPYANPEWQANTFAAELLIPYYLISGLSVDEVMVKCRVSRQCAVIQMKNYKQL